MMCYVDSSAALRWLFRAPGAHRQFGRWQGAGSSELLLWECHRALDRRRLEGSLGDDQLAYFKSRLDDFVSTITIVHISDPVRRRLREPFATVVGTLDAVHLSTAALWRHELGDAEFAILTHDRQLAVAAKAMGMPLVGTDADLQ